MCRDTSRINEQKAIARFGSLCLVNAKELLLSSKPRTQGPAQLLKRPWTPSAALCPRSPRSCAPTLLGVLLPVQRSQHLPASPSISPQPPRAASAAEERLGLSLCHGHMCKLKARTLLVVYQLLVLCWLKFPE